MSKKLGSVYKYLYQEYKWPLDRIANIFGITKQAIHLAIITYSPGFKRQKRPISDKNIAIAALIQHGFTSAEIAGLIYNKAVDYNVRAHIKKMTGTVDPLPKRIRPEKIRVFSKGQKFKNWTLSETISIPSKKIVETKISVVCICGKKRKLGIFYLVYCKNSIGCGKYCPGIKK